MFLSQYYTSTTPVLHQYYISTTLVLHQYYTSTAQSTQSWGRTYTVLSRYYTVQYLEGYDSVLSNFSSSMTMRETFPLGLSSITVE